MSWYRQQLEDWLKTLNVKANKVVDIGGFEGPVKDRVKNWDVKEYLIADSFDPGEDYEYTYDIVDLNDAPPDVNLEEADVVFCLEVMEYIFIPDHAMAWIASYMKPGAKAYVTFAFAYPHHEQMEFDSLRYTEYGVRRLAENARLDITNIWYRTDRSGLLRQFYAADGMHPAKRYDHHDVTGFIVEFTK